MGHERKMYVDLVEMTHIYHEMQDAELVKVPEETVSPQSTVFGCDELCDNLISWAEEFERKYPDTDEYLTDIRTFAEAKFLEAYGTARGKEKRRAMRVMEAMKNIDWTLYTRQKKWLSVQVSALEPSGSEAYALPEGILNLMDTLQDAWEGEGEEAFHTVWDEFCKVPYCTETGCIAQDWRCFRAGTKLTDIWDWFRTVYGTPVDILAYLHHQP